MTTRSTTMAEPAAGTITDRNGKRCTKAGRNSYPLKAWCEHCGHSISAIDGAAEWAHFGRWPRCDTAVNVAAEAEAQFAAWRRPQP